MLVNHKLKPKSLSLPASFVTEKGKVQMYFHSSVLSKSNREQQHQGAQEPRGGGVVPTPPCKSDRMAVEPLRALL